jgi:ABC-type transport system substrate-binding protein
MPIGCAAAPMAPKSAQKISAIRISKRARQLIIASGYKGEKVVLVGGADVPAYNMLTLVTADRLKKIGINVDLQWSDVGSVRAKKDPPDQGGWNLFIYQRKRGAACQRAGQSIDDHDL